MPASAPHLRPGVVLTALCAAGLLGACDVTIRDGDVSLNQLHGRTSQEWRRTYRLTAGGGVEVVNLNGPISVRGGPAGTVDVVATLSARAMTDERARQLLSETRIEESVTPDQVKLVTVQGARRGRVEVTYMVAVPPDARVEISTSNGTLEADGLRGNVKATAVNGTIELTSLSGAVDATSVNGSISTKMAEVTGRLRLECVNGRITLEVPADTKATLSARSVNGGITVTGLTAQEVSGKRIHSLESVLNGGGPEIDVRVTNGRIAIAGRP